MLMNYHIGRLVLSSLCVGAFGAAGFWWCSFCRLQPFSTSLCKICGPFSSVSTSSSGSTSGVSGPLGRSLYILYIL